uniref:Uncharacterized protein n=1 Tax=Glossina morsitans morsitans TaxID=37546 RepID=A0A1B0GDI2_GLOMM
MNLFPKFIKLPDHIPIVDFGLIGSKVVFLISAIKDGLEDQKRSEKLKNQRIVVTIDSWPRTSRFLHDHFVRSLGPLGDVHTEKDVILLEHDVPHSKFSEEVLNCLPKMRWIITPEDYAARDINIRSVDPPGCTDIDDALHCRELLNGNLEVGVHIADFSHFIRQSRHNRIPVCTA